MSNHVIYQKVEENPRRLRKFLPLVNRAHMQLEARETQLDCYLNRQLEKYRKIRVLPEHAGEPHCMNSVIYRLKLTE